MPFSVMKEQIPDAFELLPNGQAQANQRQKRKARLRLARRVALATVCLLIGICVYSVLDPVPVSYANSLLNHAKAWIGTVLQLDGAMDVPPPSDFQSQVEETSVERGDYKTIEEIHTTYGLTVYEPTQMKSSMKLNNVEATMVDSDFVSLRYRYAADGEFVVLFTIQPMGDLVQISYPDDATKHTAPVGEFNVFKAASDGWYAVALTNESIINIHGKMDKDAFLKMLDTLRVVN